MGFVIHWHESAMELHVFPIPIPPPTSLSTKFLWVFPVHQARALVSCITPGLVICFTIDNIHAVLSKHSEFFILGYSPYTYCKRYKSLSHVQFFMTLQTVAHQVPLSKEFSRQDRRFWSGLPISSSRGSSWPGNQTLVSCIAGRLFTVWAIREWDANQCKSIHHILDITILSDTDFFLL